MNRFLFPLLTVVMCVVLVAAGIELTVRWIFDDGMQFDLEMWKYAVEIKTVSPDPLIGHIHAPDRHARLMGVTVDTNSRGLRDREFADARTPGVLRIEMLGDSFTEGWGTAVDETFSKRIERLYATQGIKAEAINTGVGNWNTIEEVEYFLTEGYRYHPDIVVLNFVFNDAEPVPHDAPPSFLMRHCYSCIFVLGRFDSLYREVKGGKDWAAYYLGLFGDGDARGWLDAKAWIKKLADYCKANGIKLLIASHPELHDPNHYRLQKITDLVHQAADENGVAFVDLLPYVQNLDPSTLWVTPPDPHPNGRAHERLAAGIFEALQKLQ